MPEALEAARRWADAADVDCVSPGEGALQWLLDAMQRHHLGRKRMLDTLLAATRHSAGVRSILTLNEADFAIFPDISCLGPK